MECKLCVHKPVCSVRGCCDIVDNCRFFLEERWWIPVTERRPDGECLAISMIPGPTYKEKLVGWIVKAEEWETGYVCEGDSVMLPNVTHWMQPEPPKEGAT